MRGRLRGKNNMSEGVSLVLESQKNGDNKEKATFEAKVTELKIMEDSNAYLALETSKQTQR